MHKSKGYNSSMCQYKDVPYLPNLSACMQCLKCR